MSAQSYRSGFPTAADHARLRCSNNPLEYPAHGLRETANVGFEMRQIRIVARTADEIHKTGRRILGVEVAIDAKAHELRQLGEEHERFGRRIEIVRIHHPCTERLQRLEGMRTGRRGRYSPRRCDQGEV